MSSIEYPFDFNKLADGLFTVTSLGIVIADIVVLFPKLPLPVSYILTSAVASIVYNLPQAILFGVFPVLFVNWVNVFLFVVEPSPN